MCTTPNKQIKISTTLLFCKQLPYMDLIQLREGNLLNYWRCMHMHHESWTLLQLYFSKRIKNIKKIANTPKIILENPIVSLSYNIISFIYTLILFFFLILHFVIKNKNFIKKQFSSKLMNLWRKKSKMVLWNIFKIF